MKTRMTDAEFEAAAKECAGFFSNDLDSMVAEAKRARESEARLETNIAEMVEWWHLDDPSLTMPVWFANRLRERSARGK